MGEDHAGRFAARQNDVRLWQGSKLLGGGYLAVSYDPTSDRATVYRSSDLETWTDVAQVDVATETFQLIEIDGGALVIAWGSEQQTLWFVDLGG